MNSNEFFDDFIDNVIIGGLTEDNPAYAYFKELSTQEKYNWLNDVLVQRKQTISEIDKTDELYVSSLEKHLKGIPFEDESVYYDAKREFDVLWSKKGKTL